MTDEETVVTLVNTSPVAERQLIVQGGSYGEHQIVAVDSESGRMKVEAPHLRVRLAPGAGATLRLAMRRYINPPTLRMPFEP